MRGWRRSGYPHAVFAALLCLAGGMQGWAAWARQPALSTDAIREQLHLQKPLSCAVRTGFPVLLFDFKMHSPFVVTVPVKAVKESKLLNVRVWTVPTKDLDGKPFTDKQGGNFLASRFSLSNLRQSGNQFLQVSGSVATGAGEYRHFVSVDDGEGLGCVKEWKVKAKPERSVLPELALKPGEATDPQLTAFARQRAVAKREDGIRVAVMMNVDNRSWRGVLTDANNMIALAAALRRIAEDERVREVALTAFSLEDQEIFLDQPYNEIVDFRLLRRAFQQLKPGLVDWNQLNVGSEAQFLADLLRDREAWLAQADLVLFVGARSPVSDKVSPAALEGLRMGNASPVAYLVTNPFRWRSPLNRDVIGHAVKALGGAEKEIRLPADLTKAVQQMVRESMRQVEAPVAQ
jgi:hypothetical protein